MFWGTLLTFPGGRHASIPGVLRYQSPSAALFAERVGEMCQQLLSVQMRHLLLKAAVWPCPSPGLGGRPLSQAAFLPPKGSVPRIQGIIFIHLVAAILGSEKERQFEKVP